MNGKLRVLDEIVAMVARVHGLARVVRRFDWDLARQMTRCSASVALNVGEAQDAEGGNRRLRLKTALGSARETIVALRVCGACGYLSRELAEREIDRCDRIAAILYKLARR